MWFMRILGLLFSLTFIFFGMKFILRPKNMIQALQRIKYKREGEPRKNEITFSIIMGVVFTLIGLYYLGVVVVSIIYPA